MYVITKGQYMIACDKDTPDQGTVIACDKWGEVQKFVFLEKMQRCWITELLKQSKWTDYKEVEYKTTPSYMLKG